MTDAPYSPHIVAAAKATLHDLTLLAKLDPDQRADLVRVSYDILRTARAARTVYRRDPAPVTALQNRPRIIVQPVGPTSGDAA